jgi:hypothetical protein
MQFSDLGRPNQTMLMLRKRAALTKQQAMDIFDLRIPRRGTGGSSVHLTISSRSVSISKAFGVSPKAVRDIWNRRTWCKATSSMLSETDGILHENRVKAFRENDWPKFEPQTRKVGRPRGSKDSKPRQRRHHQQHFDLQSKNYIAIQTQQTSFQFTCPGVDRLGCESDELLEDSARIAEGNSRNNEEHGAENDSQEISLRRTYPFFLQFD